MSDPVDARLTVGNREAAGVFANLRQRHILLALVAQERSLSDLAAVSDTPLNLLHRHVSKFVRLGLAQVSRREARAGRAITFYRASASTYFVPADLAGSLLDNPVARQMREALERNTAGTLQGILYSHDGSGPRMQVVKDSGSASMAAELWRNLHLTEPEARELAQAFKALLERYDLPPRGDRRKYLAHTAFVRA
ncbi:MAG: hypothetical protein P0Y59_14375 [Candidatus Sphingomonas phytovorans]|nr:hypothetical protein [Sphingomonas sp.]WEJ98129.1 MAG: hypothetical protein P0Y59_14375 [Sphingomonas sp.]